MSDESQKSQKDRRRVVVLTSGGDYAERVLLGCALRAVQIEAVLVVSAESRKTQSLLATARKTLRQHGIRRLLSRGFGKLSSLFSEPSKQPWVGLADQVISTGPLNGPRMLDDLAALAPDYLVLGGVGVVGESALKIPVVGTINAHPALLPFARGVGVVGRSIQRGVPVGVTLHFVDPGIDTGQVIRRELTPVNEIETVTSLDRKAYASCVELLVEATSAAFQGRPLEGMPQSVRFPYCRWLTTEERHDVSERVSKGLARRLYRKWFDFYGSNTLPSVCDAHPPIQVKPLP